jgi:hypothetical protein
MPVPSSFSLIETYSAPGNDVPINAYLYHTAKPLNVLLLSFDDIYTVYGEVHMGISSSFDRFGTYDTAERTKHFLSLVSISVEEIHADTSKL